MNSGSEEEGFQKRDIPQEILSLAAKHVLPYDRISSTLSLRMNIVGTLSNWKNVACLLGYTMEMILGLFAHDRIPGLSLLEHWMYKENGSLGKLVSVYSELEMNSCLEVIYDCVAEYENRSRDRLNNPVGDSDDSDRQPSSLTSESSASSDNNSVSVTSSDASGVQDSSIPSISSIQSSQDSLPLHSIATCPESKTFSTAETHCTRVLDNNCVSANSLKNPKNELKVPAAEKPGLFRCESWPPSESDCRQSGSSERSSFNRSYSHTGGTEKKKKSFIKKRIDRIFRKGKPHKKSPVESSQKLNLCSSVNTEKSSMNSSTAAECQSFSATYTYNEPPEKPSENLSPLKVDTEEARRLSLTDSMSSGESISSPTSPGYESGYNSSEGPSVSSGISISIVYCSDDMEGDVFQKKIFALYRYFSETLGYKCHLDKLEMLKIAENKFRYAVRRVKHSDFLFICVSPKLKSIFDSPVEEISDQLEDDENCMLRLVSDLILTDLANNAGNKKGKFMTIILEGSSKKDVPCFLESYMKYSWPRDERKIRCIIEGQPEITPAPVSDVRTDPPSQVVRPAELL